MHTRGSTIEVRGGFRRYRQPGGAFGLGTIRNRSGMKKLRSGGAGIVPNNRRPELWPESRRGGGGGVRAAAGKARARRKESDQQVTGPEAWRADKMGGASEAQAPGPVARQRNCRRQPDTLFWDNGKQMIKKQCNIRAKP